MTIAVLGAGSWGTALALVLARNGHPINLWGHEPDHQQQMIEEGCNQRYLPGIAFPDNLSATLTLADAIKDVRDILIVVPSHGFRQLLIKMQPLFQPEFRLAWATKGVDPDSGQLLSDVAAEIFSDKLPMAVLSGPSFAKEVAEGLPTAVTLAANQAQFAQDLQQLFHNDVFRAYTCDDLIGLQLGGTIKNVLAVATGIADGYGFGANARCALITRGMAEMTRLGLAMRGRLETFMGLAGMGDLILTCTDDQSRNRRFGLALGKGATVEQALASIGQVVESISNTENVYRLAQQHQIDMPIIEQVYQVVDQGKSPAAAIKSLLTREPKAEY